MTETLLRAAEQIRQDASDYLGPDFFYAIADWLDLQAERLDGVSEGMIIEDHPALRAARAYLAEGV